MTRIYADAAAATPLSKKVAREMLRLLPFYGNPGALHEEAALAKAELQNARERIAKSIGAHADEIVFTSGGTEGNNLAIRGMLEPLLSSRKKVHAITNVIEHASVLEPLRALQKQGLECTELPINEHGLVATEDVRGALTERTTLVSVQLINSEIGTLQPVRDIAKILRGTKTLLHCDASQAPLWQELRVEKLGVHLMTLDGQKILGPKGVGVLYVRRGIKLSPQLLGGGQERGIRSGTENVLLAGAFAVALEDAQKNAAANSKKIAQVRDVLLKDIQKRIPGVKLNGAVGEERVANNLNISVPYLDGQMAVIALSREGVAASTRSACDASDEAPSHVLSALHLSPERMQTAIRLTLLPTATVAQAKATAKKLADIAKRYQNMA